MEKAGIFSKFKELGSQTIIYGLGDALYKLVSFILLPLYLKYLNPAEYGTIETLMVTRGLVVTFVAAGLPGAVFRFYSRAKNADERKKITSTIFFLSLFLQILIPSLFFWQSDVISRLIFNSPDFGFLFAILAASIFLTIFRNIPLYLYRAQNKAVMYSVVNFSVALITLLMNIYFVAFLNKGVLGVILGNICGGGVGLVMVFPTLVREIRWTFEFRLVKSILIYAVPLGLAQIPLTLIFMADRYYLARLTSLSDLGIYALAYKLGNIINFFLVMPLSLAWAPFVFAHEQDDDARTLYSRMTNYFVIVGLSAVVIISIFSIDIIKLMTHRPEFQAAYGITPLLCYAFFFFGLASFFRTGVLLSAKTYFITIIMIISLCLNLISNYVFIKAFGYVGAAYSLLLTILCVTVLSYIYSSRIYFIKYDFGKLSMMTMVSIIVIVLSRIFIPANNWQGFLFRIGLVILFVVYLYFGAIPRKEREHFKIRLVRKFGYGVKCD